MDILVIGSVAFDSVETPFGRGDDVLGGSATYFSTSASFFTGVQLVAVVGDDFPEEPKEFLSSRGVDLAGLQTQPGKTFRWKGRYGYDLNEAQTLETHLNVFETFHPQLPEAYRKAEYVFLANIDPELQLEVLNQVERPKLIACDTMNFWIEGKRDALVRTLGHVDILVINEAEVRQLADEANLVKASRAYWRWGRKPWLSNVVSMAFWFLPSTRYSLLRRIHSKRCLIRLEQVIPLLAVLWAIWLQPIISQMKQFARQRCLAVLWLLLPLKISA